MKHSINTLKTGTLATTLVLASLFFSPPILAGANHDHGHDHGHNHNHTADTINQEMAKQKAKEIIRSLIKKNKIDQSWQSISAHTAEQKPFDGRTEWVVIFSNHKISDPKKQKLYIFLTLHGEYIAANHTGN